MSAVKSVNLCCDNSDCPCWGAQFGGGVYATATDVRACAKQRGWTHVNGKDYCPKCATHPAQATIKDGAVQAVAGESEREDAGHHKLDTATRVFFYEQDFYVLSNFSAFRIFWNGRYFDTSEAAYHCEKFPSSKAAEVRYQIMEAASAHEAFKIAERNKALRRPDWDAVKVDVMREILRAKADQHEYVRRKLLATGERELIEDSWRDDFWGWGPNRDGQNMLGKLWMELRTAIRASRGEGL